MVSPSLHHVELQRVKALHSAGKPLATMSHYDDGDITRIQLVLKIMTRIRMMMGMMMPMVVVEVMMCIPRASRWDDESLL